MPNRTLCLEQVLVFHLAFAGKLLPQPLCPLSHILNERLYEATKLLVAPTEGGSVRQRAKTKPFCLFWVGLKPAPLSFKAEDALKGHQDEKDKHHLLAVAKAPPPFGGEQDALVQTSLPKR